MDFPSLLLPPPQHQLPTFSFNDERKRFLPPNSDFLPPFGPSSGGSPFLSALFPMGAPPMSPIPPPMPSAASSLARRNGSLHSTGNSNSPKSSLFPPPPSSSSMPFDFTRSPLLPPGLSLGNTQFESDRYRFLLEQQARDRDMQFAMMAAAANGGGPPPSMFNDPNSSALFKHYWKQEEEEEISFVLFVLPLNIYIYLDTTWLLCSCQTVSWSLGSMTQVIFVFHICINSVFSLSLARVFILDWRSSQLHFRRRKPTLVFGFCFSSVFIWIFLAWDIYLLLLLLLTIVLYISINMEFFHMSLHVCVRARFYM